MNYAVSLGGLNPRETEARNDNGEYEQRNREADVGSLDASRLRDTIGAQRF